MEILRKIARKRDSLWSEAPVTIAFLGDSVTQGAFELNEKGNGELQSTFDIESGYPCKLRTMLSKLFPTVTVTMINAGIGGGTAPHGLSRLERDVLSHHPDLVVVCFGLNDSLGGMSEMTKYLDSLREIFIQIQKTGAELIFMTPNMMATKISDFIRSEQIKSIAENMVKVQNEGVLDNYLDNACELCKEMGVRVCDCNRIWKNMAQSGVDTTCLLANYINHPVREMNWLFAGALLNIMISD